MSTEPRDALLARWKAGDGGLMDGIAVDAVETAVRALCRAPQAAER